MQKLRFSSVFWDFGGVITSSPFEAFSKFEIDNHLPKDFIRKVNSTNHKANAWAKLEQSKISLDEFDELFREESKSLGHEVNGGEVLNLLQGEVRPEMVRALEKLKSNPRDFPIFSKISTALSSCFLLCSLVICNLILAWPLGTTG